MEGEDKGYHWDCRMGSAKLEFGADIFWIPELVKKSGKDVFLSLEDAVASLKRRMERDITGAQKAIQGLYGQMAGLKDLLQGAPSDTIEQ